MGDESTGSPIMSRICWWLVDILSLMLEPDEREAVRGDLTESSESGPKALRDVIGLVVRRQAILWTARRPWLALVFLVVPLGTLLCLVSRRIADKSAVYIWLYANNWDWAIFRGYPAFRHDFLQYAVAILIGFLTLFCWSWSSGLALGAVSRGSTPVNGVLFGLLLFLGELMGAPPRYLGHALFYRARDFSGNAAVFGHAFFRVVFPLIVQATLVLAPSIWAMRQSRRVARLRPALRRILWTATIATLIAAAIQNWGLVGVPYNQPGTWSNWEVRMLQLIVYWPVAYGVVALIDRRYRTKIAWNLTRS